MKLVEFHARIQEAENGPVIPVHIIAPEEITRLPREEAKARLSALLNQVRCSPEFTIYGFATMASYVDPPPRDTLIGYNTLVEISLPYTLHLPTNMPFEMSCPAIRKATVVMRKTWTNLATGSNDAEIYADGQLLYYRPALPSSPMPQAPELGP